MVAAHSKHLGVGMGSSFVQLSKIRMRKNYTENLESGNLAINPTEKKHIKNKKAKTLKNALAFPPSDHHDSTQDPKNFTKSNISLPHRKQVVAK